MRKTLVCLLAIVMMALCAQAACAETMRIVNCNEWVSLRNGPSSDSTRIVTIPLGATVESTGLEWNGFHEVQYEGMTGFVMSQYLLSVNNEALAGINLDSDDGASVQPKQDDAAAVLQSGGDNSGSRLEGEYPDSIRKKLEQTCDKPVTQWNYWDFDGDGSGEAFAEVMVSDPNFTNDYSSPYDYEVWYIDDTRTIKLCGGYPPLEMDKVIIDSGKVLQVISSPFGVEYVYAVIDGEPIPMNMPNVDCYYLFQNTTDGKIVAMSQDIMLNESDGYTNGRYCYCQNLTIDWDTRSFSASGDVETIRFDETGYQDYALTLNMIMDLFSFEEIDKPDNESLLDMLMNHSA